MNRKVFSLILLTVIFGTFFASLSADSKGKCESSPKKWGFTVATMFRDEARYLPEWIEFHKLVGAEHFYLYNHLSIDNYLEVLQPYIKSGEVELIEWTHHAKNASAWLEIQRNAFRDAINRADGKADWLAVIDTDEFVFTNDGARIQDYLRPLITDDKYCSTVGGVQIGWLMFGTSHIQKVPENQTLIETLLLCKGPREEGKRAIKTICRPDKVLQLKTVHRCFYKTGFEAIQVEETDFGKNLQLNHYWTRDEDFFHNVKLARRESFNKSHDSTVQKAGEYNAVPNSAILRYVPALRKKLGLSSKAKNK